MAKQKYTSKKNSRGTQRSSHRLLYGVLIVVLVGIGIAAYAMTRSSSPTIHTTLTGKASTAVPAENTKAAAPNTVVTTPTPTPTLNVPGGKTGSNVTSTATLTAPSGTFVSNHGSSNQPVDQSTQEASNCITTSGATCSIEFTNNGTTKSLSAAAASNAGKDNQNGTATWSWTPSSLGLTPGAWTVTAVATLNGQTKTTQDPTPLTVQ
jgi:hypothetical protein